MNKIDKITLNTIEQISKDYLDLFVLFQCSKTSVTCSIDINMAAAEPIPTTSDITETKSEKVIIFVVEWVFANRGFVSTEDSKPFCL